MSAHNHCTDTSWNVFFFLSNERWTLNSKLNREITNTKVFISGIKEGSCTGTYCSSIDYRLVFQLTRDTPTIRFSWLSITVRTLEKFLLERKTSKLFSFSMGRHGIKTWLSNNENLIIFSQPTPPILFPWLNVGVISFNYNQSRDLVTPIRLEHLCSFIISSALVLFMSEF